MAWNQPGGAGDKDPWGKRKPDQAFDFDQTFRSLRDRFRDFLGQRGNEGAGAVLGIALIFVLALIIWVLSGFYVIQQGERGVVLRFGQKTDIKEAGLHWRLPYPIARVEKVNVEKMSSIPVGYRLTRTGGKSKIPKEALMLTQDEAMVDVEFVVQYKIDDVEAYLFNIKDVEATIARIAESAVREVVARNTLDLVLTEDGRGQISRAAVDQTRKALDRYQLGVTIVSLEKPVTQPPEEVRSAFDEVAKINREAQNQKAEAEAYGVDILQRARAVAARQTQEAEGYKATTITRAEGDARRFAQIANEYVKAPAITRERLYIETMEQVLSNTTKVFVDQKAGNNVIYLPLDKLVPADAAAAADATAPATTEPEATPGKDTSNLRGRSDQRKGR